MANSSSSAERPEQIARWSTLPAGSDSAVAGPSPKALPNRSPVNLPDVSGLRRENSRLDLLLTSLQRVYRTGDALSARPCRPNGEPADTGDATRQLAIGLIETVFEAGDLDPFPFVNRSDDSVETEPKATAPQPTSPESAGGLPIAAEQAYAVAAKPPVPVSGADRRKLPRRDSDCSVLVSPYAGEERLAPERANWIVHAAKTRGYLVDVSMSGVAVHLTDEFEPGTRVVMRISNRTLNRHVDTSATVLRCRRDGEIGWNVVCRFDKNLTFEQIHLIGRNLFAHTIV